MNEGVAAGPSREPMDWPFFGDVHRAYAARLDAFAAQAGLGRARHDDMDGYCRGMAAKLGAAGLLDAAVPRPEEDGSAIRSLEICLARETLAWHCGLADFVYAMQGLGSGPVALAGDLAQKREILPRVRSGQWLAAFALSEENAGSDVGALTCAARRDGDAYVLDGEKTWISNGGVADVYTVFARTGEGVGSRGVSAFVVFPGDKGFSVTERIDVMAPHPLASISFENCRIPAQRLLGAPGEGFKIAMRTLDIFRASVAAAALGMSRRALDETLAHVRTRTMFGGKLADLQLTQAALGEMATEIDASALLTWRAAWRRDTFHQAATRETAMAKMAATEAAQRVIDRAVQLHGGRGVRVGETVESLYREVRALRIYEGATEVQKIVIARDLLKQVDAAAR